MLRYKQAAVQWINGADPADRGHEVSLASANEERTVYLITNHDGDGPKAVSNWVKANYKALFESELEGWYTLESMWPRKRTFALFNKWFDVECHSVIEDTVGTPILDDET